MLEPSRSLPQAPDVDRAMALVCSLPTTEQTERRVDVQTVISRATSHRELVDGVALVFENSDESARSLLALVLAERNCCARFTYALMFGSNHQPLELHVRAGDALVQPLKDLYLGLMPVRP